MSRPFPLFFALGLCLGLLAGCVNGPSDSATVDVPKLPPPSLPTGIEYLCPPGPNQTQGGLCVGRIVSRTESNVEPYLALHPTNPDVMVIGVNAHQSTEPVAGSPPDLIVRKNSMDFFFTEDGGASWRRETLPYVSVPGANPAPIQMGFAGDPALEFDEGGTLHVSALVSSTGLVPTISTISVIYTSTSDLGRTWTPAVALDTDSTNDRNWITAGPNGSLYVPWQNTLDAPSSEVAWSLDGGTTWKNQEPGQVAHDCPTVSIVLVHEGAPLFACAGVDGDGPVGIQIHELDPQTGKLTQRASLTSMPCYWPQMVQLTDGSIVLVGEACRSDNDLRMSRSLDGGRTWSEPAKITAASQAKVDITMWLRADPWGGLHLLATKNYGDLAHLVLDPKDFRILHDQVIRPAAPASVPPSVPPQVPEGFPMISGGDHYYGLVFTEKGGFLVWARDYGVDYARLAPVFAAETP